MPSSLQQALTDLRSHLDFVVLVLAIVVVAEGAIILLWARRAADLRRRLDDAGAAAAQARAMAEAALAADRQLYAAPGLSWPEEPRPISEEARARPPHSRDERTESPPREIYSVHRSASPGEPSTAPSTSPTGLAPGPGAGPTDDLGALIDDDAVRDPHALEAASWASAATSTSGAVSAGDPGCATGSWVLAAPTPRPSPPAGERAREPEGVLTDPPMAPLDTAALLPATRKPGEGQSGEAGDTTADVEVGPAAPPPAAGWPPPGAEEDPAAPSWPTTAEPTTADVVVPTAPGEEARRPHEPGNQVLLVEDDYNVARLYRLLLEGRGYSVRHAADGATALDEARRQPPDLILLDVMMPKMNGVVLLQELRHDPRLAEVPVVILSNFREQRLVDRALELGALEYMVKAQTRPEALVAAVPHWMRGERAFTR